MNSRGLLTLFLAGTILVMGSSGLGADTPRPTEYEVKAAFLYNFTKFVDWPAEKLESDSLVIGVYGENPFEDFLGQATRDKRVRGRHVVVRECEDIEQATSCHAVFVRIEDEKELGRSLEILENAHVLTISDTKGFTRQGGMIGFVFKENRIRFEVNALATHDADLRISSKLLKLATAVRE
jgi:hypothetical protein